MGISQFDVITFTSNFIGDKLSSCVSSIFIIQQQMGCSQFGLVKYVLFFEIKSSWLNLRSLRVRDCLYALSEDILIAIWFRFKNKFVHYLILLWDFTLFISTKSLFKASKKK